MTRYEKIHKNVINDVFILYDYIETIFHKIDNGGKMTENEFKTCSILYDISFDDDVQNLLSNECIDDDVYYMFDYIINNQN